MKIDCKNRSWGQERPWSILKAHKPHGWLPGASTNKDTNSGLLYRKNHPVNVLMSATSEPLWRSRDRNRCYFKPISFKLQLFVITVIEK